MNTRTTRSVASKHLRFVLLIFLFSVNACAPPSPANNERLQGDLTTAQSKSKDVEESPRQLEAEWEKARLERDDLRKRLPELAARLRDREERHKRSREAWKELASEAANLRHTEEVSLRARAEKDRAEMENARLEYGNALQTVAGLEAREKRAKFRLDQASEVFEKQGMAARTEGLTEFPYWPPPSASTSEEIPRSLLTANGETSTFGTVADRLRGALDRCGYTEIKFYGVPGGFAIVTRMEQFYADGRSKEPPARWAADIQPLKLSQTSILGYLEALLWAPPGYYRVVLFVVTSSSWDKPGPKAAEAVVNAWLDGGQYGLPKTLRGMPFEEECKCIALVYEFKQTVRGQPASFDDHSILPARNHMEKSLIRPKLRGE